MDIEILIWKIRMYTEKRSRIRRKKGIRVYRNGVVIYPGLYVFFIDEYSILLNLLCKNLPYQWKNVKFRISPASLFWIHNFRAEWCSIFLRILFFKIKIMKIIFFSLPVRCTVPIDLPYGVCNIDNVAPGMKGFI